MTATYALVQVTVSATSGEVTVKGAAEQLEDLASLATGSTDLEAHTRHKLMKEFDTASKALQEGDTEKTCHRLGKFL